MKKGSERTTKYHIRHSKQLKQRKARNRQVKIDKRNYNPMRLNERRYRKMQGEAERAWAKLNWYQKWYLKIKYWFKK